MCRVFCVSTSGYYAWASRPESSRSKQDRALKVQIKAFHKRSGKTYGSPRIYDDFKDENVKVGCKRVARLMREERIKGELRKKYKCTTNSNHKYPVAANLLDRKFEVKEKNTVWVSDITYIRTAFGWMYLAIFVDLFSRKVVGHKVAEHMRAELVIDALDDAIQYRDIYEGELLVHSDQGVQYASEDFREKLQSIRATQSMSRRGNCWDNAVAESFFATLKKDLIHRHRWTSRSQVVRAVDNYIENFYNRHRKHSAIGNLSPANYERLTMLADVA